MRMRMCLPSITVDRGILYKIPEMFTNEVKITSRHLTTCEGQGLEWNIII